MELLPPSQGVLVPWHLPQSCSASLGACCMVWLNQAQLHLPASQVAVEHGCTVAGLISPGDLQCLQQVGIGDLYSLHGPCP